MTRDPQRLGDYLAHMLEAIERIEEYVSDVDEMAFRGRRFMAGGEQAHLPTHAAVAEFGDAQAGLHDFGEGDGAIVPAAGFHHQADGVAMVDVEQALLDQPGVHHGIEPAIIDHVVDVAIGIIVHPAGGDQAVDAIIGSAVHGDAPCQRFA